MLAYIGARKVSVREGMHTGTLEVANPSIVIVLRITLHGATMVPCDAGAGTLQTVPRPTQMRRAASLFEKVLGPLRRWVAAYVCARVGIDCRRLVVRMGLQR